MQSRGGIDPRMEVNAPEHVGFIRLVQELDDYFTRSSQTLWRKYNDWWDLFLAQQRDTRDPIDEMWRSNVFVPLPFTTTRTKAAQTCELIGNTEPVWQVEATREDTEWYQQSKHYERLLDYVARNNMWRKFVYKLALSRSVQGTTLFKVVWVKKSHKVTLFASQEDEARFLAAIKQAEMTGAPQAPSYSQEPDAFEAWRRLLAKAGKTNIPAPPLSGPTEVIEYEGPTFQQLPIWTVRVDPMIDELADQPCIIHRMVKPLDYILDRADDDPESPLPYWMPNVQAAINEAGEQLLQTEQVQLANSLGLAPEERSHPYYKKAAILQEVWKKDHEFQYSLVMNRKWVINKRPFERPLLTSHPNIFAIRNIIVPGHFYGLSDYQESETLFTELNTFRRLRMDGAMLNTLPVFVKQQGVNLTEALKKLRPGMVITLPTINAIKSLIDHKLPAEAYREPAEIKLEIEDATEVYSSTKGAPAPVGRVTGTEFQGRAGQTLLKYKVDTAIFEDEVAQLPQVILSLFAQMGNSTFRKHIGGDPDALVDVSRSQLIEALGIRFRFRGATKNIQPDLQVQQLMTAVKDFQPVLTPQEQRLVLQTVLELLDVRGSSRILSAEGSAQIATQAGAMQQAGVSGNMAAAAQAQASQVPVPRQLPPEVAAALSGAGGQAGPPPA